jgi:hypothetical protein
MMTLLVVASAPAAAQPVSHAAFDRMLHAHVRDGLVDYDAFARSAEFQGYLRALGAADPAAMSRSDQLAYWINSYNAFTIQLINKHGERESIRNINRTLGIVRGYGPWSEPIVRAGGRTYTLDHVEQEILRKRLREPRIHFALVCAARGCPPLRREAYTGARIAEQLDDQARLFLARTRPRTAWTWRTGRSTPARSSSSATTRTTSAVPRPPSAATSPRTSPTGPRSGCSSPATSASATLRTIGR